METRLEAAGTGPTSTTPADAPAPERHRPYAALAMATLGALAAQLLAIAPALGLLRVSTRGLAGEAAKLQREEFFANPAIVGLLLLSLLVGNLLIVGISAASAREGALRRLGFVKPDLTRGQFLLALTVLLGLLAWEIGVLGALERLGLLPDSDGPMMRGLERALRDAPAAAGVALALLGGLSPGIGEESMFRGFVQRGLMRCWKPWLAIAVTSVAFSLWHGGLPRILASLPFACLLGWLAWRSDSTWPGAALHAINNSFLFAMGILAPDAFETPDGGHAMPWWIVGGLAAGGLAVGLAGLRALVRALATRDAARAAAAAGGVAAVAAAPDDALAAPAPPR